MRQVRQKMESNKTDKQLLLAVKKANKTSDYFNIIKLKELLSSSKPSARLFALEIIRNQIKKSNLKKSYYSLSKRLIEDSDNNCRWQSLIIIGEYLDKYPDDIFKIIIRYGLSEDEDMRTAIAKILLEHLLEKYFEKYFSLYKNISRSNSYLLDTLSRCWVNGFDSKEQKKIETYLRSIDK